MNTPNLTLAGLVWPADGVMRWVRGLVLALLGSLLVAVCAQISVPMLPVPMTMQTFAVLAIGAAYGARLGAATLALYAIEGAVGLPVFANWQAGLYLPDGHIIATGGYIIGFILAAGLVGWLAQWGWDRNAFKMFLAMLIGAAILYIPGLVWLGAWIASLKSLAWGDAAWAAIGSGLIPFIWGDILKAALAAMAFPAAWLMLDRR
jgi:biotin transport system substrate-specific component